MVDHPREPIARRARRQAPPATPSPAPTAQSGESAETSGEGDRVAKALARAGVASRREVERLIAEGRVALNGQVLDTPAVKITPADVLTVDGRPVAKPEATRVWRYHKPVGLVTSHSDPGGRPTVFDNLPAGLPRVISVGRLDLNSEGLLLLTNDGELSRALELPANAWMRRYRARAYGRTTQARLDTLKDGVTVDGVAYGPIDAKLDKVQHKAGESPNGPANVWITVTLNEGKNREVRRVLESLDLKVNRLVRLSYGPFALATLPVGAIEEVGPRVIREQLAAYVPAENLPSAERTLKPASSRSGQVRPGAKAAAALAEAIPVRGAEGEAVRPEKPAYKAGWAKPKPRPARTTGKGGKTRPAADRGRAAGERAKLRPGATLIDDPSRAKPTASQATAGEPRYGKPRAADPGPARATERPSTDMPSVRERLAAYRKEEAAQRSDRPRRDSAAQPSAGEAKRSPGKTSGRGGRFGPGGVVKDDRNPPRSPADNPATERTRPSGAPRGKSPPRGRR